MTNANCLVRVRKSRPRGRAQANSRIYRILAPPGEFLTQTPLYPPPFQVSRTCRPPSRRSQRAPEGWRRPGECSRSRLAARVKLVVRAPRSTVENGFGGRSSRKKHLRVSACGGIVGSPGEAGPTCASSSDARSPADRRWDPNPNPAGADGSRSTERGVGGWRGGFRRKAVHLWPDGGGRSVRRDGWQLDVPPRLGRPPSGPLPPPLPDLRTSSRLHLRTRLTHRRDRLLRRAPVAVPRAEGVPVRRALVADARPRADRWTGPAGVVVTSRRACAARGLACGRSPGSALGRVSSTSTARSTT